MTLQSKISEFEQLLNQYEISSDGIDDGNKMLKDLFNIKGD